MHNRLPMGLASSPYIATMAMKFTFNDAVLEKFKEEMGYSMFEFKSYDDFLKYYLDDCIIFTSKHSKNVKYNSNQTPNRLGKCYLCIESARLDRIIKKSKFHV